MTENGGLNNHWLLNTNNWGLSMLFLSIPLFFYILIRTIDKKDNIWPESKYKIS